MAKRQHFIPRLLLKGFVYRTKGNSAFVHLFLQGDPPREVNIVNVAVARYFYGTPGEGPVDAILTAREGEYGALLDELRRREVRPERKRLMEEFVTHLIVRTKNARDAVTLLGEAAFAAIERSLQTASGRARMRQRVQDNLLSRPEVRDALAGMPPGKRRRAEKDMRKALSRMDPGEALAQLRREEGGHDLPGMVRRAQFNALGTLGAPPASAGALGRFEWSVVPYYGGGLILGDLGPLAIFGGEVRSPLHGGAPLEAILLPISTQCLLIGALPDARPLVDEEVVNRTSAEYSRDFLIAAQNTERERAYHELIGRKALDRPEWMDDAARKAFEDLARRPTQS